MCERERVKQIVVISLLIYGKHQSCLQSLQIEKGGQELVDTSALQETDLTESNGVK